MATRITSISATNHIGHNNIGHNHEDQIGHHRQIKSISATCRYQPHDIGHKRSVNLPLLLCVYCIQYTHNNNGRLTHRSHLAYISRIPYVARLHVHCTFNICLFVCCSTIEFQVNVNFLLLNNLLIVKSVSILAYSHTLTRPKDNKTINKHSAGLRYLKYRTFGGRVASEALRLSSWPPIFTDTELHNGKTDNDRQIINKQHAAAQINQHTNQHNKQKQHKS